MNEKIDIDMTELDEAENILEQLKELMSKKMFGGPGSGRRPEGGSKDDQSSGMAKLNKTSSDLSTSMTREKNAVEKLQSLQKAGDYSSPAYAAAAKEYKSAVRERQKAVRQAKEVMAIAKKAGFSMADLKTKKGVEIFSVGNWNDTEITSNDLDEIIRAWKENPSFKLPLKLGHNDAQRLLQQDGLPAAGWIGNLYRNGNKLLADLIDIPSKIYQLIENGAYRQVSSEVFFNITVNGKKYGKMLAGLALLGADVPGVMNLNDILAMYGHKDYESLKTIIKDNEEIKTERHIFERTFAMEKTELELKLEQELAAEKANFSKVQEDLKKIETEKTEAEKQLAELKEFKANQEKKDLETAQALKEAKLQTFITELQAEKLSTPSMKAHLEILLGEEKQNYTIQVTEKDKQEFANKQDVLKAMLVLFKQAALVNFEENSETGKNESDKLTEEQMVAKATELAKEKSVSFKQALRQIRAEQKTA